MCCFPPIEELSRWKFLQDEMWIFKIIKNWICFFLFSFLRVVNGSLPSVRCVTDSLEIVGDLRLLVFFLSLFTIWEEKKVFGYLGFFEVLWGKNKTIEALQPSLTSFPSRFGWECCSSVVHSKPRMFYLLLSGWKLHCWLFPLPLRAPGRNEELLISPTAVSCCSLLAAVSVWLPAIPRKQE